MGHRGTQSSRIDAQAISDLSDTVRFVNVTKGSHSMHRLDSLEHGLRPHVHAGRKPIEGRTRRRAVTDQDVDLRHISSSNLILIPLVAKPHTIRPSATDAGDLEPRELTALTVNIPHEAEVRMVVISGDVEHVNPETSHHLQGAIDAQQIVDSPRLRLLMSTTCTGKVTNQQYSIELWTLSQSVQDLIQHSPAGVNVSYDTEDWTQRTGFICIKP